MATTNKRERVRDAEGDGRTRLLDAARDLFLARGFAAVSIGEISAAAGMTRGAPYYHFKDKEDLFIQVFLREVGQIRNDVTAIVHSPHSFRDRLERIIVYALTISAADTGRLMDDLQRHVAPTRLRDLMQGNEDMRVSLGDPIDIIRPLFAEAAANGELRRVTPELAATVFTATVSGLVEMVFREKFCLPQSIGPEEIVDVLIGGF